MLIVSGGQTREIVLLKQDCLVLNMITLALHYGPLVELFYSKKKMNELVFANFILFQSTNFLFTIK